MPQQAIPTDTRDMEWVHNAFRRAFNDAPGQIASVGNGDTERAQRVASYLREVLWLLHAHHEAEDELLYPLLVERAPDSSELYSLMASQHAAVTAEIEAARAAAESFGISASPEDGERLSAACRSLLEEVAGHLTQEEDEVVPLAARTVTPQEWGALPEHAFSSYSGSRPWLVLGIATEMFPDEVRAQLYDHLPGPVAEMWRSFGGDAFEREMSEIRAGGS